MSQWTIHPSGVRGGVNKTALVGCRISLNDAGTAYQFEAPDGTPVSTTTGSSLPTVPFNFPMFNNALAGSEPLDWYITVDTLTGGRHGRDADGGWSNTTFPPGLVGDPTDTWTAQAGAGAGDDEEEAASACA